MALKKSYETNEGVTIDYWKITGYSYINVNGKCNVTVSGYLNKTARDANKAPVINKTFILSEDFDTKEEMYVEIKKAVIREDDKEILFFDKAIDC